MSNSFFSSLLFISSPTVHFLSSTDKICVCAFVMVNIFESVKLSMTRIEIDQRIFCMKVEALEIYRSTALCCQFFYRNQQNVLGLLYGCLYSTLESNMIFLVFFNLSKLNFTMDYSRLTFMSLTLVIND